MKKQNLLLASVLAVSGLALVGCNSSFDSLSSKIPMKGEVAEQAVSVVSLLNTNNGANALKRAMYEDDITQLSEDEINDIKAVLGQVDTIIANDNNVVAVAEVSDDVLFDYKMTITYTDIYSKSSDYILYFNQTIYDNGEEADVADEGDGDETNDPAPLRENGDGYDHSDDWDDHHQWDRDTDETVTYMQGILLDGESRYNFLAVTVEEVEEDETESSANFMLYNEAGFVIKAEQETEVEISGETEREISYSIFNGETLVSHYSLEVEIEAEEIGIRLVMDGKKYRIHQRVIDGHTYLMVKFADATSEARLKFEKVVTIDAETGAESVEYVLIQE